MIARGFKPVGWVAGVAAAALGCYMLSLNVAAERAELAKLEYRIVMAKRDIRSLQTELGTRGRMQQLESWNANVLALSAPTSAQYLDNELTLARFDQREKTIEERSVVQMASVDAEKALPAPRPRVDAPVQLASAATEGKPASSLVHRASLTLEEPKREIKPAAEAKAKPAAPKKALAEAKAPAPEKKKAGIDDTLARSIRDAAKAEKGSAGGQ